MYKKSWKKVSSFLQGHVFMPLLFQSTFTPSSAASKTNQVLPLVKTTTTTSDRVLAPFDSTTTTTVVHPPPVEGKAAPLPPPTVVSDAADDHLLRKWDPVVGPRGLTVVVAR